MMKYTFPVLSLLLVLLMVVFAMPDQTLQGTNGDRPVNFQTLKIDGFQSGLGDPAVFGGNFGGAFSEPNIGENLTYGQDGVVSEWKVEFSQFRANTWDVNDTTGEVDSDDSWMVWLNEENINGGLQDDEHSVTILPEGLPDNIKLSDREILGIKAKYNFRGYNWIRLTPRFSRLAPQAIEQKNIPIVMDTDSVNWNYIHRYSNLESNNERTFSEPYFIQFIGKTQFIDVWVWGCGYNYDLEMTVEDFRGQTYVLPVCNLSFMGWQNVRVEIPSYIPQEQQYGIRVQPIKFLGFKVTADPTEREDNFFIYFDYMQALVDTQQDQFFGDDLLRSETFNPGWN